MCRYFSFILCFALCFGGCFFVRKELQIEEGGGGNVHENKRKKENGKLIFLRP